MALSSEERELVTAARSLGITYEERDDSVRGFSRIPYLYWMTQDEPPYRVRWWDGSDSPQWLEWHRLRGIDPYAYRARGYRLPDPVRRAVIERDGYVCGLCGGDVPPADLHVDHIRPRRHGGLDTLDNLQVAHAFCNISKGCRIGGQR